MMFGRYAIKEIYEKTIKFPSKPKKSEHMGRVLPKEF